MARVKLSVGYMNGQLLPPPRCRGRPFHRPTIAVKDNHRSISVKAMDESLRDIQAAILQAKDTLVLAEKDVSHKSTTSQVSASPAPRASGSTKSALTRHLRPRNRSPSTPWTCSTSRRALSPMLRKRHPGSCRDGFPNRLRPVRPEKGGLLHSVAAREGRSRVAHTYLGYM